MKKLISCLLAVLILLALCACGGKTAPAAPAPTQAPAPAEPTPDADPAHAASGSDLVPDQEPEKTDPAPAETDPPAAPEYPVIVPIGESVEADLDLDGTPETICVSLREDFEGMQHVVLKINGVDCSDHLFCDSLVCLDNPDPDYYAITDLYDGDPSLEIAIQDWGPSDDYYTNFYRYYNGSIYTIGGVPGLIESGWGHGSITFDGKGNIHTDMRLDVLQTWFAGANYVLNNAEILELEPPELYEATTPTDVTLLVDLTAYNGKDGDRMTVEAGVQMTVEATDNMQWIYCRSSAEDWALWFRLNPDDPFEIETPAGYVPVWEALDGLLFAD